MEDHINYHVPHPSVILGMPHSQYLIVFCMKIWWIPQGVHSKESYDRNELLRWTYTNPVLGNLWIVLAKGHCTLALPLWLYCDDTSGNTSKKWNEHNSFLFMLAGLPQEQAAKEYNVHFLCMSKLAPLLEMMDGTSVKLSEFKSFPFRLILSLKKHKDQLSKMEYGHGILFTRSLYWSFQLCLLYWVTIQCIASLLCWKNQKRHISDCDTWWSYMGWLVFMGKHISILSGQVSCW